MNITRPFIAGGLAIALTFTGTSTAHAEATDTASVSRQSLSVPSSTGLSQLENGLELIMSVPDSILNQGNQATQVWMEENYPSYLQTLTRANLWGCAGAIAAIIASTALPAAKILKIKKLIKALGGVNEAAAIIWGASFNYEKLQSLGGAAAALAAELLGIAEVQSQCFS